ncbi:hypothetical protein [Streptomyces sp. A1547]|uniref:hypothetical protein n=1 Tax=Streptomyces sp. A1547 TaxID=2563105 RepID=UPI00061F371A|nr:hypothetical protein [Streptomyces sp. A1547]KJY45813.1 hypothetical protein VR46_12700 [Streptomyces sp. NRRL S-444]THA39742.1 hypothetical protein E6W17_09045 [Streptomyces sp. A1547]
MTASEKSTNSKAPSGSSRSNGATTRQRATQAAQAGAKAATDAGDTAAGTLTVLPAPLAEKTRVAAQALRGTVGRVGLLWSVVRARKAAAAGAATGTATLVAASYAVGRRAGRRQRGPLSRLTGGRL